MEEAPTEGKINSESFQSLQAVKFKERTQAPWSETNPFRAASAGRLVQVPERSTATGRTEGRESSRRLSSRNSLGCREIRSRRIFDLEPATVISLASQVGRFRNMLPLVEPPAGITWFNHGKGNYSFLIRAYGLASAKKSSYRSLARIHSWAYATNLRIVVAYSANVFWQLTGANLFSPPAELVSAWF